MGDRHFRSRVWCTIAMGRLHFWHTAQSWSWYGDAMDFPSIGRYFNADLPQADTLSWSSTGRYFKIFHRILRADLPAEAIFHRCFEADLPQEDASTQSNVIWTDWVRTGENDIIKTLFEHVGIKFNESKKWLRRYGTENKWTNKLWSLNRNADKQE